MAKITRPFINGEFGRRVFWLLVTAAFGGIIACFAYAHTIESDAADLEATIRGELSEIKERLRSIDERTKRIDAKQDSINGRKSWRDTK